MATTEVQLVRIRVNDLPLKLNEDLFFTWEDGRFADYIVEYFRTLSIEINYHDANDQNYDLDEIELSEKALTWLKLKYS